MLYAHVYGLYLFIYILPCIKTPPVTHFPPKFSILSSSTIIFTGVVVHNKHIRQHIQLTILYHVHYVGVTLAVNVYRNPK